MLNSALPFLCSLIYLPPQPHAPCLPLNLYTGQAEQMAQKEHNLDGPWRGKDSLLNLSPTS